MSQTPIPSNNTDSSSDATPTSTPTLSRVTRAFVSVTINDNPPAYSATAPPTTPAPPPATAPLPVTAPLPATAPLPVTAPLPPIALAVPAPPPATVPGWVVLPLPSGSPITLPPRLLIRQDVDDIPLEERWYAVMRARATGIFYGWFSVLAITTQGRFCRVFRTAEDAWLVFMFHLQQNNVQRIA
ncbi:hypothetical protein BDN72DRAFT_906025 [Pluteus cervinus]|uniref:Uncharacterized protein n=1 Tax=Pluteus cervinus TaxID=181527 RepID=A0ACD3A0P3_9AGAR|nr:hypothetical protein BDN72DRAFT_906025 [Pluteus cervinus]